MLDRPLDGQLALVTGASRGIGAATAEALGAMGAHVVLTARTSAGLEEVEQRIFDTGGAATIAPLDLTATDSIAKLAAALESRWSALDVLVLNAATLGTLGSVPSIEPKEMAAVLTLNVSAQGSLIAAFDPMLRRAPAGKVIGVTSSVAKSPRAYWGLYGASKAAFETLLGAYGDEMGAISRVRTAIVDPGATRTTMRGRAYPGEDPLTVKEASVVGARIAALAAEGFTEGHRERVAG